MLTPVTWRLSEITITADVQGIIIKFVGTLGTNLGNFSYAKAEAQVLLFGISVGRSTLFMDFKSMCADFAIRLPECPGTGQQGSTRIRVDATVQLPGGSIPWYIEGDGECLLFGIELAGGELLISEDAVHIAVRNVHLHKRRCRVRCGPTRDAGRNAHANQPAARFKSEDGSRLLRRGCRSCRTRRSGQCIRRGLRHDRSSRPRFDQFPG